MRTLRQALGRLDLRLNASKTRVVDAREMRSTSSVSVLSTGGSRHSTSHAYPAAALALRACGVKNTGEKRRKRF